MQAAVMTEAGKIEIQGWPDPVTFPPSTEHMRNTSPTMRCSRTPYPMKSPTMRRRCWNRRRSAATWTSSGTSQVPVAAVRAVGARRLVGLSQDGRLPFG